jgi:hypothetical protein
VSFETARAPQSDMASPLVPRVGYVETTRERTVSAQADDGIRDVDNCWRSFRQ